MKVINWIDYTDENLEKYEENNLGGLGGFFIKGMRWKNYKESFTKDCWDSLENLRKSIIENNIKIKGEEHQNGENTVPLFEDNTIATYSYRAWGDLMAAVWSEEENKDYCYMDFYM